MKFTVRDGFVVQDVQQRNMPNGEKMEVVNVFVPGMDAQEMSEDMARQHLHKIEPADKAATKFMEDIYEGQRQAVLSTQPGGSDMQALIAAAVAAALPGAVASAIAALQQPPK